MAQCDKLRKSLEYLGGYGPAECLSVVRRGSMASRPGYRCRAYQPMWWPPLMSRLEPVIQLACSSARKPTP